MPLTIKALSYKDQPLRELLVASFGPEEGTLGRSSENHFILPDPEKVVSHIHAIISCENGRYYLKDVSSNGTFVANKNRRVHRESVQLDDKDTLRIGDYDLVVSIAGKSSKGDEPLQGPSSDLPDPGRSLGLPHDFDLEEFFKDPDGGEPDPGASQARGVPDVSASHVPVAPPRDPQAPAHPPELPHDFDLEEFFKDPDGGESDRVAHQAFGVPDVSASHVPVAPPRDPYAPAPLPELPLNFEIDTLLDDADAQENVYTKREPMDALRSHASGVAVDNEGREPSPSGHAKPVPQGRDQAYEDVLRILLEGAGIRDTPGVSHEEIPELMRTAGAMLREAITGLATILRGRAAAKSHMRLPVTTIQAVENNPLKFSVAHDETLKLLLATRHPGYINGVEAIREGCADIRNHELALTAGLQAAVNALLERFDPQHFAKPYAEGLVLQRKAKCWDAYRQAYGKIVAEAHEDIFGEAFLRAYEGQMGKLRSRDHKG